MKRLGLVFGLLLLAAPLSACAAAQNAVATAAASSVHTTPAQAHAVAIAENAYTVAATGALVWVQTTHPSQAVKDRIKQLNDGAHDVIVTMREANARGDSPAVAAALAAWQDKGAAFKGYLVTLGVPLPAGTP